MLTLDPSRHQPTAREVGDNCTDRCALVPRELSSRGDDVVVDVKRRAHDLMLAHQRIVPPDRSTVVLHACISLVPAGLDARLSVGPRLQLVELGVQPTKLHQGVVGT